MLLLDCIDLHRGQYLLQLGEDFVAVDVLNAGFGDCFEHALTASNSPRIAEPAIIASFCWRNQDESVVPEIMLLLVA